MCHVCVSLSHGGVKWKTCTSLSGSKECIYILFYTILKFNLIVTVSRVISIKICHQQKCPTVFVRLTSSLAFVLIRVMGSLKFDWTTYARLSICSHKKCIFSCLFRYLLDHGDDFCELLHQEKWVCHGCRNLRSIQCKFSRQPFITAVSDKNHWL